MKRILCAAAAGLALLPMAGCGGGGGAQERSNASQAECERAVATPAAAASPDNTVALVVDNTASAALTDPPPAILEALTAAQRRLDQLVIVPVAGPGGSKVGRTVALDPTGGKESKVADNARRITLGCVARWIREPDQRPANPGSDILAALATASRQNPRQILVMSDGLNNVGEFDLNKVGFDADPAVLADGLAADRALAAPLASRKVLWTGLGNADPQLREALRAQLAALWAAVLKKAGAEATFDTRSGGGHPARPSGLPADEVKLPEPEVRQTGCATEVTVPAALVFGPNSAVLQPGTETVLDVVVTTLREHPDWTARIGGHTANYGSADGQRRLSLERAEAVAGKLVGLGVERSRLSTAGYGSTRPAVAEFHDGGHDEAAAAKNRRVVIEMGAKGCLT